MNKECDILITGAGPAGIAAAVTAAKKGLQVILIEKENFLGGTIVTALLNEICGLYLNKKDNQQETLNKGLIQKISDTLKKKEIVRKGRVYVMRFSRKELISLFKSLLAEKENLQVIYNTEAAYLRKEEDIITSVNSIKTKAVIDCTGEGKILKLAHAYQPILEKPQLSGYTFSIKDIADSDDSLNIKTVYLIKKAIDKNQLPSYLKNTTFTLTGQNSGFCRFNIVKNSLTEEELYDQALKVYDYLKDNLPEFKNSYIEKDKTALSYREGLRLKGGYTLTEQDILKARKFRGNGIKNAWPIEIWQEQGCKYKYLPRGEYYEIPDKCLKSSEVKNLYAAGRCISVTQKALASTRVVGPCISLGERAASLAVKDIHENIIS